MYYISHTLLIICSSHVSSSRPVALEELEVTEAEELDEEKRHTILPRCNDNKMSVGFQ